MVENNLVTADKMKQRARRRRCAESVTATPRLVKALVVQKRNALVTVPYYQ